MRYLQAYVDTEGEMHLIDLDQYFEQGWDLLTHNATRDAMWAAEARMCLSNLKLDLDDCLRNSSGKRSILPRVIHSPCHGVPAVPHPRAPIK